MEIIRTRDDPILVAGLSIMTSRFWKQTRFNTLRPRQNGRRFADDTFKRIFLYENVRILIYISLKFVPKHAKGPIINNPALIQIMAWRRSGDKPLSEPMMVSLLTHICVTRPQWVKATVGLGKNSNLLLPDAGFLYALNGIVVLVFCRFRLLHAVTNMAVTLSCACDICLFQLFCWSFRSNS